MSTTTDQDRKMQDLLADNGAARIVPRQNGDILVIAFHPRATFRINTDGERVPLNGVPVCEGDLWDFPVPPELREDWRVEPGEIERHVRHDECVVQVSDIEDGKVTFYLADFDSFNDGEPLTMPLEDFIGKLDQTMEHQYRTPEALPR